MSSVVVTVNCKTNKVCPLCRVACIQSWETVCGRCWVFLGMIDRVEGTNYQQQIKDNKRIVIRLPPITFKLVSVHYPLTKQERMQRARRLAMVFCTRCPTELSDDHGCEKCWVHWLMNEILGNGEA